MKTSIALATYNGEKYLNEQLNSFLNQTVLPDEVIISDDASGDNTLEIARSFKSKAPFDVRILESETNVGFVKNFEKAIKHTTGDLIFLSDQDDIWFSNKIETINNKFKQNAHIWVAINDQEIVGEQMGPTGLTRLEQLNNIGYSSIKFKTGCCTAFHKDLKPFITPIPSKYISHDVWIHYLALYLNKRAVIDKVLQYYRRHNENVSNDSTKEPTSVKTLSYYVNALKVRVDNYTKNIYILEELKDRIEKKLGNKAFKKRIIDEIEREIEAWKRRDQLENYGFLKKRIEIVKMLLNGDYTSFKGYKSFWKDFIT